MCVVCHISLLIQEYNAMGLFTLLHCSMAVLCDLFPKQLIRHCASTPLGRGHIAAVIHNTTKCDNIILISRCDVHIAINMSKFNWKSLMELINAVTHTHDQITICTSCCMWPRHASVLLSIHNRHRYYSTYSHTWACRLVINLGVCQHSILRRTITKIILDLLIQSTLPLKSIVGKGYMKGIWPQISLLHLVYIVWGTSPFNTPDYLHNNKLSDQIMYAHMCIDLEHLPYLLSVLSTWLSCKYLLTSLVALSRLLMSSCRSCCCTTLPSIEAVLKLSPDNSLCLFKSATPFLEVLGVISLCWMATCPLVAE